MSFERGDKVIIPSKPDKLLSDEPNWGLDMDDYIGKEGTIIDVLPEEEKIRVQFEDGWRLWYSFRWFKSPNNDLKANNLELNNLELLLI